jgi:DNA-binding Lrp family transcriptional regulator
MAQRQPRVRWTDHSIGDGPSKTPPVGTSHLLCGFRKATRGLPVFKTHPCAWLAETEGGLPIIDAAREPRAAPPADLLDPGQPVQLDPVHLRILHILERDGRASVAAIAREVGLTDNAVRYRIRKLRNSGVVRRVTVHVDPTRLGRHQTCMLLLHLAPTADIAHLRRIVGTLYPTRGPYQAVAVVVAKDAAALERIVARLRADPTVRDVVPLEVDPEAEVPVAPSACTRE